MNAWNLAWVKVEGKFDEILAIITCSSALFSLYRLVEKKKTPFRKNEKGKTDGKYFIELTA